jgi:hypothetical protein
MACGKQPECVVFDVTVIEDRDQLAWLNDQRAHWRDFKAKNPNSALG